MQVTVEVCVRLWHRTMAVKNKHGHAREHSAKGAAIAGAWDARFLRQALQIQSKIQASFQMCE